MALAPEILREQMARRDRSEFADLIETPAVGAVTFPANARFVLRSVSGNVSGVTAATVTGPSTREIKVPALAAGERGGLQYAEAGSVVTPEAGFDVLLDNGLGRYVLIGGGAVALVDGGNLFGNTTLTRTTTATYWGIA